MRFAGLNNNITDEQIEKLMNESVTDSRMLRELLIKMLKVNPQQRVSLNDCLVLLGEKPILSRQ